MSKLTTILSILAGVVSLLKQFFDRRREANRQIKDSISEKEKALSKALEEGRITDAGILAKEIRDLYEQYRANGL